VTRRARLWPRLPVRPLPRHPYRDTAVVHAGLAGLIVVFGWLTGGSISKAIVVAGAYFVLATSWAWWKFRQRLRRQTATETEIER
jgi:hypothetical protein